MTETLQQIPFSTIDGEASSLGRYSGKVVLVVNVASKCSLTPQYEGLEALYRRYREQGLVVVGFPANDFLGQEPGSESDIADFCRMTYDVTFPLFAKLHVNGKEAHPLYAALTGKDSPFPGPITWNFNKFLISRDGKIIKRFDSKTKPESAEVTGAIEEALAAK